MLPPVRTSSFVDYQTPSQQPMLRQRIDVANTVANSGMIGSSPMSAGRLDVLSLSAQLQLAQGFSIFAETIGRLIKVPRREGEALADYAQRLSEAVKTMNPAEKAALERTLNQLVKGISIRLLTEILNNPAGPEAARVAIQLETAQLLERDLVAKAVVSSYRQNAGAEQVPSTLPQPANAAPSASSETSVPTAEAESQAAQPGEETAIDGAPPEAIAADAATQDPDATATSSTTPGPTMLSAEAAASPTATDNNPSQMSAENDLDAAPASISAQEAAELPESEAPETAAARPDETTENPSAARPDGRQTASAAGGDRRMSQPVFYDGPALARLSQRGLEQQNGVRGPNAEKMANEATTIWLAEVLAEATSELLDGLPVAARQLPEQQALQQLTDKELLGKSAMQANEAASTAAAKSLPPATDEPESTGSTSGTTGPSANASGRASGATELAEQLALPIAVPHAFREGVALPYVAYPPEERERDPEERKTKAISETDEDGEQQHSAGEQAFSEEGADEDHAQDDESEDASKEAVDDADRANDLYWRMAGWT
ncbi:hypothetical protein NOJ28_16630 [Neorhizobium galegae]|uniref:hypothetical protein n=1 Tax=Neorhizobium galegae TaxID=399 RepID=UPI000621F941|nr:hypothetical protein [Neorhizobium galegae]MCQ1767165.1 hypothetical protein [Neorhizobium galegae]MCQ1846891.1 hypothetical protein [Neorhizobium galegae]CDZ41843.1 Hypothetical protein NGAL_HAMBI1146_46070 [Neorhizobium galegae bv. officinalis]